ncbi:MAG: glycoside hydrolase family 105 protein [Monoglobaceae bacterium]
MDKNKYIKNKYIDKDKYIKEIIHIADRMLETRPREEVILRPYIKPDFASRKLRRGVHIDLKRYYTGASEGDFAYVSVNLKCQSASVAALTVKGADVFTVNGKPYEVNGGKAVKTCEDGEIFHIDLNEGDNAVVFKCVCEGNVFELDYTCAHIYWPQYWTCDYLLWVRDTIPLGEYSGEQGFCISELVSGGERREYNACAVSFPGQPKEDEVIDFNGLYQSESGKYALAYSVARCDGRLNIKPHSECEVYINNDKAEDYRLKKGDEIKIICERAEGKWGFECMSNDILYLPNIEQNRNHGCHWLLLGSFDRADFIKQQFKEPYENADGEMTFWRLAEENTYLRPYLDSSFYGQWFYAIMVGELGLLYCSEYKEEYRNYFCDSMSILYEYYKYMQYDARLFGDTPFLKRSVRKGDLDSIGTIGTNLCELYLREADAEKREKIMYVLEDLAKSIYKNIPRMDDGCFYRIDTMWADDTYMSCPFLVRMGNITGNEKYYREAADQLRMYKQRLYIDSENIFSHIYFPDKGRANGVPWGRGNGWVYLALIDVIEHLPQNFDGRGELVEIYSRAVGGVSALQGETGLWRQVLNMPSAYAETSCTAIFSVAIARGIRAGILEREVYLPVVEKAVCGLLEYSVDECGDVTGVCRGSGCKDDPNYYAHLETIKNDDHGTGMVLRALYELIKL